MWEIVGATGSAVPMISLEDEAQVTPDAIAEQPMPGLLKEASRLAVVTGRPGQTTAGQIIQQCLNMRRVGVLVADNASRFAFVSRCRPP